MEDDQDLEQSVDAWCGSHEAGLFKKLLSLNSRRIRTLHGKKLAF